MLGDRIQSFLHTSAKKAARKAPLGNPLEPLEPLLPAALNQLSAKIIQLPPPQPCQNAVKAELTRALKNWQADPELANNSLVVLGRPVEDVARILRASLQEFSTPAIEAPDATAETTAVNIQFLLGGYQRPLDPLEIAQHIRREIAQKGSDTLPKPAEEAADSLSKRKPTVVVVPSLENCFLRCIQGWEGIEYLQNLTTRDTSRFWVFGCNHWAWTFLDRVCQISAYLEQPLHLPELSGEDLKAWLQPILESPLTLDHPFQEHPFQERPFHIEPSGDSYWSALSNAASGIGATAATLWLNSLRIRVDKSATLTVEKSPATAPLPAETVPTKTVPLLPIKPTLPTLMSLDVMDRYILHTLLIHREMTRSHLALSLGEAERKIRSRLQVLRREGILLQRGRRLSIHPAHYPKLYSELKNNNFLIGEA
ncbi:MAG: MarR family transcriptional regulator [Cyanobacteria bacterium J06634_5]